MAVDGQENIPGLNTCIPRWKALYTLHIQNRTQLTNHQSIGAEQHPDGLTPWDHSHQGDYIHNHFGQGKPTKEIYPINTGPQALGVKKTCHFQSRWIVDPKGGLKVQRQFHSGKHLDFAGNPHSCNPIGNGRQGQETS